MTGSTAFVPRRGAGAVLLRSTKFPDSEADMGRHEFTYSLLPHTGDWRAAGVDIEAEALNRPLFVLERMELEGGASLSPFTISSGQAGSAGIEIAAVKPAESGDRLMVRLVETRGVGRDHVEVDWHIRVRSVESVDVMERSSRSVILSHDQAAQRTRFAMRPFEIVTLAVERV
jgi:alpha-mannosidase